MDAPDGGGATGTAREPWNKGKLIGQTPPLRPKQVWSIRTKLNMEGRAQRYFQNFDPAYYDRSIATLESWRWLCRIRSSPSNPR